jgi:hypothetical protein
MSATPANKAVLKRPMRVSRLAASLVSLVTAFTVLQFAVLQCRARSGRFRPWKPLF